MRSKALKFGGITGVVGAIVIALGAMALVDTCTVPPPKPYDQATYDVYSDLLQEQEQPWLYRLLYSLQHRQPEAVLIRVESLSLQDLGGFKGSNAPSGGLALVPKRERFKLAVDSAMADYLKRNTGVLELQRKFNLSHYDLFTKAEEDAFLRGDPFACQKYAGYDRWVELSAVGFNGDQTVAVVHFVDWGGRPCSHTLVGNTSKDRMLQKRNGKWYFLENRSFSDVIQCSSLFQEPRLEQPWVHEHGL